MSDWYTGEKFKGNETVSRFKTVDDMIESAIETKRTLTEAQTKLAKAVELPSDLTIGNVKPILAKLGVPADAKGYGLADHPTSPKIAEKFLEAGILPAQVPVLQNLIAELNTSNSEAEKARIAKLNDEFKVKAGDKLGEYEETLTRFAADKLSPRVQAYEKLLGIDPLLAKTFALDVVKTPAKEAAGPARMPTAGSPKERVQQVQNDYAEARKANRDHFLMHPDSAEAQEFAKVAEQAKTEAQAAQT